MLRLWSSGDCVPEKSMGSKVEPHEPEKPCEAYVRWEGAACMEWWNAALKIQSILVSCLVPSSQYIIPCNTLSSFFLPRGGLLVVKRIRSCFLILTYLPMIHLQLRISYFLGYRQRIKGLILSPDPLNRPNFSWFPIFIASQLVLQLKQKHLVWASSLVVDSLIQAFHLFTEVLFGAKGRIK